jgi:undecaprenyl-diphosphatase
MAARRVGAGAGEVAGATASTTLFVALAGAVAAGRTQDVDDALRQPDQSFPSGHTAATAALALTVARLLERSGHLRPRAARVGAALVTLAVAETRLMLDEHWPTDVLAGALLGAATACSALAVAPRRATQLAGDVACLTPQPFRRRSG